MKMVIYRNNIFTGHMGHIKNMLKLVKILAHKYPTTTFELRQAKDQTATQTVRRF